MTVSSFLRHGMNVKMNLSIFAGVDYGQRLFYVLNFANGF